MNKWVATISLPLLAAIAGLIFAFMLGIIYRPGSLPFSLEMPLFYLLMLLVELGIAWMLGFWNWGWRARLYAGTVCLIVTALVPTFAAPLAFVLLSSRS